MKHPDRISAPMILIVLPYEGRARVVYDAKNDGEIRRLEAWLHTQPDLVGLIQDAIEAGRRAA